MQTHRWNRGIVRIGGLMIVAAIGSSVVGWGVSSRPGLFGSRPGSEAGAWGPRVVARRAAVEVSLTAGGRVESTVKSLIECELESLSGGAGGGRRAAGGGSATIIELIPDGSSVRRGEVLCRFDSSEYEEMARRQEIEVERARADRRQAELDLESAELALHEHREGVLVQRQQELQGRLALAEADLERQKDRVAWAERMVRLGYFAAGNFQLERHRLLQAEVALGHLRGEARNFRAFIEPNLLVTMERRVESARSTLEFQTARFAKQEKQLEHYRRQVERCTVRAPNDGVVIYANDDDDDDDRIELGARVRQKQDLFHLPDLSKMEVQALLHETVVERVRPGMPARVRIEAFPGQVLPGRVVTVARMPMPKRRRRDPDVKNYLARVALDAVPAGLRPGMTAAVEILAARKAAALVVPTQAVAVEDGRDVCYVAGPRGPERRPVVVAPAGRDLLEVTRGLAEGEEVLLDPPARFVGIAGQ